MSRETALEERSRFVSSEQLGTDRQPAPRQESALQSGERAARVARATLLLALAVGAVLRLWQLNRLGYNSDEAVYAGQAAAIVGDPGLKPFFPVFRAHPLLFQFLVSLSFLAGVRDWVGRLWAVAFGLATIYLVFRLGRLLYGSPTGALAATFLALMPYHVIVSRQVLLDGPMTFFATLTLYALARFGLTQQPGWLYVTGATMGLTVLTKETSILLVGAAYAFLALSPEIRLRVRDVVLSLACLALVVAPFPASLLLAGGQKTAKSYLIWQLFRRPNHGWDFYASVVPSAIGPAIVLLALAGLWLLRRQHSWRERLLCAWIVVPCVFFELWPVKGFQYLLPIAPAVALLAARTLTASYRPLQPLQARPWAARLGRAARFAAILAVLVSLALPAWQRIQPARSDQFLAGTGGVPGGREAGRWLAEHTPENTRALTIGPSMANIIQFYGHRKANGLAVSPNPLHRNPSYEPVINPDLQLHHGEIQYLIWDSFSAGRSPFFSASLMRYVDRYHGRAVHTEYVMVHSPEGQSIAKPVIVIYEVRP